MSAIKELTINPGGDDLFLPGAMIEYIENQDISTYALSQVKDNTVTWVRNFWTNTVGNPPHVANLSRVIYQIQRVNWFDITVIAYVHTFDNNQSHTHVRHRVNGIWQMWRRVDPLITSGTWTPQLFSRGTNSNVARIFAITSRFERVGNRMYIEGRLNVRFNSTNPDTFEIRGLPHTTRLTRQHIQVIPNLDYNTVNTATTIPLNEGFLATNLNTAGNAFGTAFTFDYTPPTDRMLIHFMGSYELPPNS